MIVAGLGAAEDTADGGAGLRVLVAADTAVIKKGIGRSGWPTSTDAVGEFG